MDKNGKIIILCESYASVKYVLYRLMQEHGENLPVFFITGLEDLHRLIQTINEKVFNNKLELIFYQEYTPRRASAKGIKKFWFTLVDISRERRHLKRFYNQHFARMRNAEIMFSSPGYSGAKIYILNKLSKKNRLTFIDPGPPYMGRYSPRSFHDISTLVIYKMIYGKGTKLGQFPADDPWSTGFPLAHNRFMKESMQSIIDWSKRDEIMVSFPWEKFRVFDTGKYKVMYFHQDLVDRDVPDREKFSRELKSVFDVVLHYFPEKAIARKYHPGHQFNKDVIKIGEEIPAYIPAEFLFNDNIQVYLGISSYAIVNVRGSGKVVSLLNLITFKTEKLREQGIEFLRNASHKEILFPKTLEELEQMLSKISGKRI